MTKFEYRIEEAKNFKILVDTANQLGEEGWEMLDIEHELHGIAVGVFKRSKDA